MTTSSIPRRRPIGSLAWLLDGRGDVRAVELLRIALAPILVLHLQPFLSRSIDGVVYSDRFYQPYVAWYPEVPRSAYVVLLWLAVAAAVALGIGLATRVASGYAAAFVAYNLFLSSTHFSHNRAFLLVLLIGVTLLPLGRRWAVDAWLRRATGRRNDPEGALWPILLMRFEIVMVFFASGLSKLIDPDWWDGTVLWLRFVDGRAEAAAAGVPGWALDVVTSQSFHTGFAKVAVLTELGIAAGLLFRQTRLAALWVEIVFHVSIEIVFSVQVFSYAALAAMVVWVTPSARDRTIVVRGRSRAASALAAAARWLDWTGRFRIVRELDRGPSLLVIDRDGRQRAGGGGAWLVLSRLPLTFWFVAPFGLPGLRRGWARALAPLGRPA